MSKEDVPSYDLKARRVKQLLSSYYGTDHQPEADASSQPSTGYGPDDVSSIASATGTPKLTSIDSPAFNAETYVSAMIRTSRVDTLLKKHAGMVKEIRSLDGDMQMLVYENYNKFITATDTIRSMKSNVDGMGEKMEELRTIMNGVAVTSDGVNSKLQKHRDGIEELSRVKVLLQKLQRVIDLPKRIAVAVKEEAFTVAVNDYCEAKALLEKYGHQGAFRKVSTECEGFIRRVETQLKNKLLDLTQNAEECASLLRKLSCPESELQELFLQGRRIKLEELLKESSDVVQGMVEEYLVEEHEEEWDIKWKDVETGTVTISSFVHQLDQSILNSLSRSASEFNSTFSVVNSQIDSTLDRSQLVTMARSSLEDYKSCLLRAFSLASLIGAFNALSMPQQGISGVDLSTIEGQDGIMIKVDSDWGSKQLCQSVLLVATDLHVLESRLPEVEPIDTMNLISKSCIQYHLSISFRSLLHRVKGTLIAIKKVAMESQRAPESMGLEFRMTDLQRFYAHLCDLLLSGLTCLVHDFKSYETKPPLLASWLGSFIDLLQSKIQDLFLTLLNVFGFLISENKPSRAAIKALFDEVINGVGNLPLPAELPEQKLSDLSRNPIKKKEEKELEIFQKKCPSGVILLCARLCTFLETTLVPHAVELLASTFPGAGDCDHPPFNPSEVIRRLNAGGAELLRVYIDTYGNSLSLMIRQSIAATDWMHHKEPRGPRSICDLIINRLESAEREIVQLVDDGGNRSRRNLLASPVHGRSVSTTSVEHSDNNEGTALERNVAKLFRQRVQLGSKAEFSHSSIQAAILGSGLKSLIECIRQRTVGRTGLQQLQLDVLYLRPLVTRFVRGKETDAIHALLEEIIGAAVERSVDPTLLEAAVVERILMTTEETES